MPAAVILRFSRAKLLPLAMLTPIFLLISLLPLRAFASVIAEDGASLGMLAALAGFMLMSLFFAAGEAMAIRMLVCPPTLTLTRDGLVLRRPFRPRSLRWSEVGEPEKVCRSNGRTSAWYISLPLRQQPGAKPLLVPADRYVQPVDAVLAAVREAWAGQPLRQPPETMPRLFAYVIVPLTGLATLMFLGAVTAVALVAHYRG